ncbi:MAG TPA: metallophosphoesterase family protein [Gemmatimonadaceae bacterium]|nr:metallophosphoesterase family protein [Gemmatimonadaceae bacterium]
MLIGLISDTHGLVRPDVHTALDGVELILHAGDVGGEETLFELNLIAPVHAVFGNTDPRESRGLADAIDDTFDGVRIHVSHGHELGAPRTELLLAAYDADVIVYGHTHKPLVHHEGKRLVVNPGAAGPRRFDIKPSVARFDTRTRQVQIIELAP